MHTVLDSIFNQEGLLNARKRGCHLPIQTKKKERKRTVLKSILNESLVQPWHLNRASHTTIFYSGKRQKLEVRHPVQQKMVAPL